MCGCERPKLRFTRSERACDSRPGSAAPKSEPTPWHATQRAACKALKARRLAVARRHSLSDQGGQQEVGQAETRLKARSIKCIVRRPHPVPAMTVRRKRDFMHAVLGPAMVLVENIDQNATIIGSKIYRQGLPSA